MINERMLELINAVSKGNKRAFSMLVGVTPTVVENIVGARKGKPGYDLLEKIAFAIENINLDWLLTGRGSMFHSDIAQLPVASIQEPTSDNSFIYTLYKEKETEIKELNTKMLAMSEEIGRLKAKLGEDEPDEREGLGKETVKNASIKLHSSQSPHNAPSANVPSDGR